MSERAALVQPSARGIQVRIRLTPKSSSDRVEGVIETAEGPALVARVRAVPSEGEANAALEKLVANWLGVPKSCVVLTAGQKSRIKTVEVRGESRALEQSLAHKLAGLHLNKKPIQGE